MTTYITINNSEIDPDSPITSELMTKLRDNPIAMAENDSSVPVGVKIGHVLLGTLTTTSGATQTLSGLTLTPYTFIVAVLKNVSFAGSGSLFLNSGAGVVSLTSTVSAPSAGLYGIMWLNLATGVFVSSTSSYGTAPRGDLGEIYAGNQDTITTASTSITFATSSTAFDAGTISVYGVK